MEYIKQATIVFRNDCNLINPPSWYLTSEIEMMFVFPVLFLLFRYCKLSIGFIILIISVIVNNPHILMISSFLVGFLAHAYERNIKIRKPILMLIVGFLMLDIRNALPITDTYIINNLYQLIQCFGGAMIILILKKNDNKFFNNRIMVFLGNISYEFFVIHFIVLMALLPFVNEWYLCTLFNFVISVTFALIIKRIFKNYLFQIK